MSEFFSHSATQLPRHLDWNVLMSSYPCTQLVEINSHSLFSKWFSESGKLVQKLFSHVTDMTDTPGTFVIVMIGTSRDHAKPRV